MYINTELNVKCMRPGCGTDGHMSQWRFACSNHPADYEYASSKEFSNALLTLTNLWSSKNEVVGDMVREMARNLRKPEHKQKFRY
jgi:hypothetical protein